MPDPRFPNRPDHPDFWLMAAAVNALDNASDAGVPFAEVVSEVDLDSLGYMAQQRTLRATMILAQPVPREAQVMASWVDGFMAGMKFQQLREKGK